MSTVHLRHITSSLDAKFEGLVDLSDVSAASDENKRQLFLARSLAAFPIAEIAGASPNEATLGITDGTHDNGLDAIYFEKATECLYLVQSKWSGTGTGSPAVGDVQKFIQGFRDLINLRFDRFNSKVGGLSAGVTAALDNPRMTIEMIFVHTGTNDCETPTRRLFDDLLQEINDAGEILRVRILRQQDVHALVSGEAEGDRIDMDVALFDWGQVAEPYAAYYGQVAASDIAAWWQAHGTLLFSRNIRKFITHSEVNATIVESITNAPEHFWYLNNGVTILCQSVARKPIGGLDRRHGQFACEGLSVVNGAQTVGAIGTAFGRDPDAADKVDARVPVRLISLEQCPPGFDNVVTRAANTQNRIVARDFVALDPEQERLRVELRVDRVTYALKTGEPDPQPAEGCSVVDATVALGCAVPDVQWAVQVKREIGKVWEDLNGSLYKTIFNPSVSSTRLWRSVQIMRVADKRIATIQKREAGRKRQIAVHGNRLLLHLVFQTLDSNALEESGTLPADTEVRKLVDSSFAKLVKAVDRRYESNYLASLFKNLTKCRALAIEILK